MHANRRTCSVLGSSSGCNAEVGGTVIGTGHKVQALESPGLFLPVC